MNHKRSTTGQAAWIIFSGAADMPWQHLLKRGFRHCFAALRDADGWSVLDPLQGRLVVARLDVEASFDLPSFYHRAGLLPIGPITPGAARTSLLPRMLPMNCVGLCRAVLGTAAPFAITPYGLYRALTILPHSRYLFLTTDIVPGYLSPINGRIAPIPRPAPLQAGAGLFDSPNRSERPMGSLFSAPKPVRVDPPAPPPQPTAPAAATIEADARNENRLRARRGLAGTITTSARGVLTALPDALPRRSLLGE
ncbi:MAG: hypothetical protein NTW56_02960 [Alphaproteobacteria bacterium]|nr:hypothetical protein [Alphaproteobacteria bacterium]